MNKNAIKKFAIEARKKLIASVSDRAGMLGITAEGCSEPISKGIDFEVYKTVAGTEVTLGRTQCEQRRKLKEQIEARGFEAVVEEVAYTWFNRICAIRFMEVNDYLPTRVRVLSSEKEGKNEPDIVTQAPDVDLDFTDKEREYIVDCKMNNKLDELFKMLFIKQCNKLSEILPELFEATEDYTEMLLNISYTNKDDIIHMLVNQENGIPEADFNVSTIGEDGQPTGQVEIIGWLYQYYNTELKDDTFAQLKKNVKISKERIPAATQLFTPDWIVRYMVENSVGRLWIEHLRAIDPTVNEKEVAERFGWKYYLPEAEQEADVNIKLAEIRTSYKDLKPEDITCIDPCMGSGHILVAMFDVLMDIYKSAGYSERDAAFEIVEHNIHGFEIDKRAYQLAYFALMMKGRYYNRRFLLYIRDKKMKLNVYEMHSGKEINNQHFSYFSLDMPEEKRNNSINTINTVLEYFRNIKHIGSLIKLPDLDVDMALEFISHYDIESQISMDTIGISETQYQLHRILMLAKTIIKKYDAVITNPPYMGGNGMNSTITTYLKEEYPFTKYDLFSAFIEKGNSMVKRGGYNSMVTMQSWMFLSSFEKMRNIILDTKTITNLMHMENMVMGIAFGTAVAIIRNIRISHYKATYNHIKMSDVKNGYPVEFPVRANRYATVNSEKYDVITGNPIAYWASESILLAFENGERLKLRGDTRQGMATSDNNRFLRLWHEVDVNKLGLNFQCSDAAKKSKKKWFPYNKGGQFRKWYGNIDYVINYENDGNEVKSYATELYKTPSRTIKSMSEYFKPCISWSKVSSGSIAFRYYPEGFIFDVAGCCIFYKDFTDLLYTFGFLNSSISKQILGIISPTLNYEAGHISTLPIIYDSEKRKEIECLVSENIKLSQEDWDSFETSWNFTHNPLLRKNCTKIEDAYNEWREECEARYNKVSENEAMIDSLFATIYNIEAERQSENVTIYIPDEETEIRNFMSYAVGCMFGRYSLNADGIVYAGGTSFKLDAAEFSVVEDNIVPITDEEYFSDDIVSRFVSFVSNVYGEENLEENLDFIADSLENKGNSSREKIRYYFINDFFNDHCSTYSVNGSGKRPIYWLFDSGKENGFKCLMYMHRYTSETVGKIRIDYLHKTQKAIEQAMHSAEYVRDNATSGAEKSSATKRIAKFTKQLAEIKQYDEAMAHIANQRIELDLDDGVKVNYAKFQGVEVAQEGKKTLKIDLLAKI